MDIVPVHSGTGRRSWWSQPNEREEGAQALQEVLEESKVSTSGSLAPFWGELAEFHFLCTQHVKLILPQGIKRGGLRLPSLHKVPLYCKQYL